MTPASSGPPSAATIPVGDRWRATLRVPIFGTVALAGAFLLYAAPVKETPSLFDHAPWFNDPFDTVISFMMFFVPLIALLCIPRILQCRRAEPLPSNRIGDVLRGCRVILAGVALCLISEWIAVAIRGNVKAWNWATWLQVGLLAAMTFWTVAMASTVYRAGLPRPSDHPSADPTVDWLGDSLDSLAKLCSNLGPARERALAALAYLNRSLVGQVRRRPLWSAFGTCALFGIAVGAFQGLREGYGGAVTAVASVLLATGMFGLVAVSGHYLGLVRSNDPSHGARRRATDSMVITCIGVLILFAFRYHLWWLVGTTNAVAGLSQLVQLLMISGAALFLTVFGIESAFRLHS